MNKSYLSDRSWIAAIVLPSILLGAINSAKVPDNDLATYLGLYHLSKDMPLLQYIWVGSSAGGVESVKEPFYPVIVWILNRLCADNELAFKFFFTFINYTLLNLSVVIAGKKTQINHRYVILGVFMITFIPYIFTLSLHAMRQFIAGALFMAVFSVKCFSNIKLWKLIGLTLLMVLLHSSSLIFIPFVFIKALDRKWTKAKLWYIGLFACLVLYQYVARFAMLFAGGMNNTFTYALNRASHDTEYEFDPLNIFARLLLFILLCSSFYLTNVSRTQKIKGIRRFFNVPLFLSCFVLLNLHQAELSRRILFYTYPFLAFVVMYFASLNRLSYNKLLFISISVLIFFLIYLEIGTWEYEIPFTVFFTPLPLYFL